MLKQNGLEKKKKNMDFTVLELRLLRITKIKVPANLVFGS